MQSAVCACKQLRSLTISHLLICKAQPRESEVIQALLTSLPELRALQIKKVSHSQTWLHKDGSCVSVTYCGAFEEGLG